MKRLLFIALLAVAMVLTMVACGGGQDDPKESTTDTAVDTSATKEAETPAETPEETDSKETDSKETDSKDTEPEETEPEDTEPKETEPKETEPKETEPKETEPSAPVDSDAPIAIYDASALNGGTGSNFIESMVLSEDGSYLTITPNAADPHYYPFANVTGGRYIAIKYRTANANGTAVQLYIGSAGAGPSDDTSMLRLTTVADGNWQVAIFDTQSLIDAGIYDGSTVSYFRFDPLECDYILDENGQPQKDETGTWIRFPMPEGATIDVQYIAFFHSAEAVEKYEAASEDDTHSFKSDIANQGESFAASDVAGAFPAGANGTGSWYDVTGQNGNKVNAGESYHLANYNEMFVKADGKYAFSATILDNGDPNRNFMFVRGVRDFHFGDQGYFGHDGDNNYAGCGGIQVMVKDGVLTIIIRSYTDGACVRNIYTVNVEGNELLLADDGNTVYIAVGDKLAATVAISGTRDFGYTGTAGLPVTIPADACADKVVLTLAGQEPIEIVDAVVAASHKSDIGMAIREHGNYITFSELAIAGFSTVTIPEFPAPEALPAYSTEVFLSPDRAHGNAPEGVIQNMSWDSIYKNATGNENFYVPDGDAAKKLAENPITLDDSWTAIVVRGWAGAADKNNKIVSYGYRLGLAELVRDDSAVVERSDIGPAGGDSGFQMTVPVDYTAAETYIRVYAIHEDGTATLILAFWVKGTPAPAVPASNLTTNKTEYVEGEEILVTALGSGKDWVGIYKINDEYPGIGSIYWYYPADYTAGEAVNIRGISEVGQDQANLGRTGLPAGQYKLILFANDGYEVIDRVDITVVAAEAPKLEDGSMTVNKTTFDAGEAIMVTAGGGDSDWVGLYPFEVSEEWIGKADTELGWDYSNWYYIAKDGVNSGDTVNILEKNPAGSIQVATGVNTLVLVEDGKIKQVIEITVNA